MPHFICRWPGGDVLLASVESRQELDAILQERCEPGVCKVARYHGPLVLELKPDIPGMPRASAERFKLGPACPAFQAAWQTRLSTGDTDLLAADGSRQRVHALVLQCRLPVLGGQPLPTHSSQVRLHCVQDGSCLSSLVEFLYLDDVVQQDALTAGLHLAALQCGLQRLVTRCEAHWAHQLEVQLLSWPGLMEAQREGVLDSLIGWAAHAEQLDRQELLQLCVHALAQHYAAAQSRPSWSTLSAPTACLVHLVAASTAPPIIHRQVLPNGTAILPALSNPGPDSSSAAAAPGSQQPGTASAGVVSADAEAFAAAGGRMTSWEWQQLQRFRDAVADCRSVPEASPLLLEAEQLSGNSLAAQEPGVSFAVKQAVLTPHKRLMDSVSRFAFPATHSLLAAGWQLRPHSQQQASLDPAGAGAGTPAVAPPSAELQGNIEQPGQGQPGMPTVQITQQQQAGATPQAQPEQQVHQHAVKATPGVLLPVPVPAPRVDLGAALPSGGHLDSTQQHQVEGRTGSDHGSCGGSLQEQAARVAPAPTQTNQPDSARPSRLGSNYSSNLQLAGAAQAAVLSRPAGSHHQLWVQAAAGAAAERRSSDAAVLAPAQASSQGNASWGSAQEPCSQCPNSQQLPGGLQGCEQAMNVAQSWGTGTCSQQHQDCASQQAASTGISTGAMLQLCQQVSAAGMRHPQPALQDAQVPQQQGPAAAGAGAGTLPAPRPQLWQLEGASFDRQAAAGAGSAGFRTQAQQELQLEGAGSIAVLNESEVLNLSWGSCSQAGGVHSLAAGGIVDLPALWQPPKAGISTSSAMTAARTMSSSAGAPDGTTTVAGSGPAQAAVQDSHPAPAAASSAPGAVGPGSTSSTTAALQPLAALQRALVEDFVLYEEASAARQHVVGILVAVEQGDTAAGQRLLAPACAELITATAPAAVPNRLAPHLNASAVLSAAAAATAAGLPAADVAAAVAVAAAEEYCKSAQGISRLMGSASSSRAALEASPRQLRQRRAQQQQLLLRALHQVSTRVPWLSRLLTPLQQSLGLNTAEGDVPAAGAGAASAPAAVRAAQGPAVTTTQEQQQQQQSTPTPAGPGIDAAEATAGQDELKAAVVELIMQLPELLHGLPGPALLSFEQYKQRHAQAQQLAAHAMQLLLPGVPADDHGGEATAPAITAADGVAAELAASGLLAAASAAMAASQAVPSVDAAGSPSQHHANAGHLFANILDSLRAPGLAATADQPPGAPAATAAAAAAAAEAALSAAYGGSQAAAGAASGFLSRTAAFAAANRLAEGLIRPPSGGPAASLGLSRAGSLAGAGQLGAWRLPAATAAAGSVAAAGFLTPGSLAGGPSTGVFAPTGTGALLSGGLLAEGGVAGDSILDDMLHGNVRRITCHGLYELCAALAQPAGSQGSPPATAQQQQQQQAGAAEPCDGTTGPSQMETDDGSHSIEGRVRTGQYVAEAVATVAAAAAAIESSRRSSVSNMAPPFAAGNLVGTKRRLSSTPEEQDRPLKH